MYIFTVISSIKVTCKVKIIVKATFRVQRANFHREPRARFNEIRCGAKKYFVNLANLLDEKCFLIMKFLAVGDFCLEPCLHNIFSVCLWFVG